MISLLAVIAFFVGETQGLGMTKQCHYEYGNERYSVTISTAKPCPVTIRVQI